MHCKTLQLRLVITYLAKKIFLCGMVCIVTGLCSKKKIFSFDNSYYGDNYTGVLSDCFVWCFISQSRAGFVDRGCQEITLPHCMTSNVNLKDASQGIYFFELKLIFYLK